MWLLIYPVLIGVCVVHSELQFHPDPARKLSTNLYDI
jgi:hypothetical protein